MEIDFHNKSYNTPLIYIIAGEPSGDILGAKLIKALKQLTNQNINFAGVGGLEMEKTGLISLFPIDELSVMGITEIVPRLPRLLKRIKQTVDDIFKIRPNILITIDSPDFTLRIARNVKKMAIPLIHYVAPSVWAWRPKRAIKMGKFVDHVLTLLPFEPPYFTNVGLNATFVGHPVIESAAMNVNPKSFRINHGISDTKKVIVLLPGSRIGEVNKHIKIFSETLDLIKSKIKNFHIVCIVNEQTANIVVQSALNWPFPYTITSNPRIKFDAMASGNIALAASGTVALELACVGTPSVITYKINFFSAWIGKLLIKVKYVNLINLILEREAIPEYLQEKCNSKSLSLMLIKLVRSPNLLLQQKKDYLSAIETLKIKNGDIPSISAAKIILRSLK